MPAIIIGDIHGEVTKLKALIRELLKFYSDPKFIFVGDYLDKGEDVLETLRYLQSLSNKFTCNFLIGNHEYLWLKLNENENENANYLLKYGAEITLKSLKCSNLFEAKKKLIQNFRPFFKSLSPYYIYNDYIITHSGISPSRYTSLIEDIPIEDFIFNRYDFISYAGLYLNRYRIIFGHTGFYYPFSDGYKIGIDTAACFKREQPLTAFIPDDDIFFDSNNIIVKHSEISTNYCPNIIRNIPWRM